MTVRWKPLVFLSGVFLIVGMIGVPPSSSPWCHTRLRTF